MLIDFCHHCVRSKIKVDKVSFDGYEADNLLSSNINKKQKGFLSDNFVKPPINVTVQFPCNVAINRIVIDPAVGQQKSCDIKIFTASEKMTDSWLYSKDGNHGNRDIKHDGVLFSYAGNVSQADPKTVCFVNYQFKERGMWCVENLQEVESFPCRVQLNCRKPGGLSNASHVTISITKTKDGKSAAIKRLEIWGIPSIKVPHPVQLMLKTCYTSGLKQQVMIEKPAQKEVIQNIEKSKINDGVLIDGVDVPEDFVDPITYEIMTVPILLPCGKNVDQLTLDRYVNTEAAWGRPPNDLFTGVPFSTVAGPVTNTSLKARIDQFVLNHSQTLRVPQTLGHSASRTYKQQNSTMTTSRLITLTSHGAGVSDTGIPCKLVDADKPSLENKKSDEDCVIISSNLKRNRPIVLSDSSQYTGNNKKFKSDLKYSNDLLTESATNLLHSDDQADSKSLVLNLNSELQNAKSDHKTNLTQSLDTALFSALGGLPSFSRNAKKTNKQQKTETVCCKCVTSLTMSSQPKYRLPCGHCVCRSCLTKDDHIKCGICLSSFQSSDAVRVF